VRERAREGEGEKEREKERESEHREHKERQTKTDRDRSVGQQYTNRHTVRQDHLDPTWHYTGRPPCSCHQGRSYPEDTCCMLLLLTTSPG